MKAQEDGEVIGLRLKFRKTFPCSKFGEEFGHHDMSDNIEGHNPQFLI